MLKIGIIGAGRIGKVHLESISYHVKNATVVAMADPFMNDETESFIRSFGVEKVYKDYKEIINDAEIDAVMVCSSTDTHAPISIEAINAGKHVFCEKPLANTVDKILEIADALKAHPEVKFQVGFNRRFDHNFAAIRKAYDEGKIGDAQILKITSRDPQAPPVGYCAASIFLDMTIHDFDMACLQTATLKSFMYMQTLLSIRQSVSTAILILLSFRLKWQTVHLLLLTIPVRLCTAMTREQSFSAQRVWLQPRTIRFHLP